MTSGPLTVSIRYSGVSPWEIEVLYSLLNSLFTVKQIEEEQHEDYSTTIELNFPLDFNDEFFYWLGHSRWEKIKGILKEMKRRRGGGKNIKLSITFCGKPSIIFLLDSDENFLFNGAIEKVDFVLELIQYHLDPKTLPPDVAEIKYVFDELKMRWRLDIARATNKQYRFLNDEWKSVI